MLAVDYSILSEPIEGCNNPGGLCVQYYDKDGKQIPGWHQTFALTQRVKLTRTLPKWVPKLVDSPEWPSTDMTNCAIVWLEPNKQPLCWARSDSQQSLAKSRNAAKWMTGDQTISTAEPCMAGERVANNLNGFTWACIGQPERAKGNDSYIWKGSRTPVGKPIGYNFPAIGPTAPLARALNRGTFLKQVGVLP